MPPPMSRPEAIAELTGLGSPYELQDAVIAGRKLRVFKNAPPNLRAFYEASASDLPFIVYQDERLTFAQAWAQAARIGQVLVQHCGVKHGDRVAIAMRNYPEWMLAFCAITSIGAVAVAMNAHWQTDEMAYALADSGAVALIADQERLDRYAAGTPLPGLHVLAVRAERLPDGAGSLQALMDSIDVKTGGEVPMPAADIAPDDHATILYTSGSTGHPKGVVSTQRNLLSALLSWELDRGIGERVAGLEPVPPTEQPGTLLAVPLFHVTGLHASYLSSFRSQRLKSHQI